MRNYQKKVDFLSQGSQPFFVNSGSPAIRLIRFGDPESSANMASSLIPLLSHTTLLLPRTAPRGFNTFDHYPYDQLNETVVLGLADAMAAQLMSSGYEYLVGYQLTTRSHFDCPEVTW